MAGDARRSSQSRKRSSDVDMRPQKRACPTSPAASTATAAAAAALSPLGAGLVGSPLSVDVPPHAPHSLPLRGCTAPAALPMAGPGRPSASAASALSPGLPSSLDLNNLPEVLDGVLLDPTGAAYPNLEMFPNEWGRRVAPDQTEPALPAPLAASALPAPDPDGGLLAYSQVDMQMAPFPAGGKSSR